MIKRKKPIRKYISLKNKIEERRIRKIRTELLKERKFYQNPEFD
jgi:hypothetical protein